MKKTFSINQLQMIPKKYENIRKITLSEGDDYTTGHLLDYNYFNKRYDSNRFTWTTSIWCWSESNTTNNNNNNNNRLMFFIIEEARNNDLDFSQGTMKVL